MNNDPTPISPERQQAIEIIKARLPLYTDIGQINALRECISSIENAPPADPIFLAPAPPLTSREGVLDAAFVDAAYDLSTWAACVSWNGGRNEKEWLDELREKIEMVQEMTSKVRSTVSVPPNVKTVVPNWNNPSDPVVDLFVGFNVEGYVEEYEWRGDEGHYTPNEQEKALLIDAIYGVVSNIHESLRKLMPSQVSPTSKVVAHPDQTSPMTVGPEAFFDDGFTPYEQALRDAVQPFLDWLEQRESGAHIQEVRDGLIGVEDVLPDSTVILGAHLRADRDQVITFEHFRKLQKAYDGALSTAKEGSE